MAIRIEYLLKLSFKACELHLIKLPDRPSDIVNVYRRLRTCYDALWVKYFELSHIIQSKWLKQEIWRQIMAMI